MGRMQSVFSDNMGGRACIACVRQKPRKEGAGGISAHLLQRTSLMVANRPYNVQVPRDNRISSHYIADEPRTRLARCLRFLEHNMLGIPAPKGKRGQGPPLYNVN